MRILQSLRRHGRKFIADVIVGAKWFPLPLRSWAYRAVGVSVEPGLYYSDIFFDGREISQISIGRGSLVNNQVYIDGSAPVVIGERVYIAAGVRILTATHEIGGHAQRAGELVAHAVSIGDGTWIGADSMIMPGVRIGAGVIVGAGSLVTKDLDPDGLYVGRPAKLVRRLDDLGDTRVEQH